MRVFKKRLEELSYVVEVLDSCNLWKTGNVEEYTISNYIKQIDQVIDKYSSEACEEITLIGHSMGGFTSIIAGSRNDKVTKIVSLCPPPDRLQSQSHWENGGIRKSKRDLPDNSQEYRVFEIPDSFSKDGIQYSAVEEVRNIHKPLMIFIALDDVVVAPELTEKIVKNAANPHVVRKEGLGHDFRFSEEECNLVMSEIELFLMSETGGVFS
jgi:pimeloyl-ACP methyl ester carboxylesterase